MKNELTERDILLIEKFLADSLSEREKTEFDSVKTDPLFKKELVFQADMLDALEEMDRQRVLEELEGTPSEDNLIKENKTKNGAILSKLISIILILGLFLFSYWWFSNANNTDVDYPQLAETYATPYPPSEIKRGMDNDQILNKGMIAYANKDYADAIAQFEISTNLSEEIQLYSANAYIQLGEFSNAESILLQLIHSSNLQMRQNADWYYAICLLGQSKAEPAKHQLEKIQNSSGHIFAPKAKDLLVKLN